jgi:hypothetical protein
MRTIRPHYQKNTITQLVITNTQRIKCTIQIKIHNILSTPSWSSVTTGIAFFAECLRHSAKAILHSAKALPSVTLGKEFIGKGFFAECFFRTLGKDFAECQKALGKEKHSAN